MKALAKYLWLLASLPFIALGFLIAIPCRGLWAGYGRAFDEFLEWTSDKGNKE